MSTALTMLRAVVVFTLVGAPCVLRAQQEAPPAEPAPAPAPEQVPPAAEPAPAPQPVPDATTDPAVPQPAPDKATRNGEDDGEDDDEDEDAPPATAALPLLMGLGIIPCCCSPAGLLQPLIQYFVIKDRPAFKNPLRGLLVGYGALGGMVLASILGSWLVGGVIFTPVVLLSILGPPSLAPVVQGVAFLGFGAFYLLAVVGFATFWLVGEPLLFWWFAR